MHSFHGNLGVFPQMPSPGGRTAATRDAVLGQTCYQCHPGQTTKCFRGEMYNSGAAKTYTVAIGGQKVQFNMPGNGWATVKY